jgi:hypothetical protein
MDGIEDDDATHEIPHLGKIDVAIDLENGAYYSIVVPRPLANDAVTRERLLRKLDRYLKDFYSPEFEKTHGTPMPGKLRIYVRMHPDSDAGIVEFLESCRPWLADNKVELFLQFVAPSALVN